MRPYKVVDAFSSTPFKGNPVAVILDGKGLSDEQMQSISAWTNLSETTFFLPPSDSSKADYTLRIFTPRCELPFAGHPTLGSAHAALEAGLVKPTKEGVIVQECKQGLVRIVVAEQESGKRTFTLELPKAKVRDLTSEEVQELEGCIGAKFVSNIAPALVDVGPLWAVGELESGQALLNVKPDFARMSALEEKLGGGFTLYGKNEAASSSESDIEVRSFAPLHNIPEDPVCGSGNGSVAVFRAARGQLNKVQGDRYTASQGRQVGRDGRIAIQLHSDGLITVGGECVTCVDGTLNV